MVRSVIVALALALASCGSPQSPNLGTASVDAEVRSFAQAIARDVTQEGPAAWRRYFADSPTFFMAVNGRLVFPDRAAAATALDGIVHAIAKIELRWGDDLRVDALTPDLAMLAATYHELRVMTDGSRVDEIGFFTGIAERRAGRWQLRDAHWSAIATP